MDKELLQALSKLLDEKLDPLDSRLEKLENKIEKLENKTDKNTFILEEVKQNIKTIAEVQTSFTEQLERAKDKDGKTLADRLNIIELSITDTSLRVKEVQKDLSRVVRATAENWAEIVELKSIK